MRIRKQYKAESAHIVRNCSTNRCKFSMHGHSTIIEVVLEGNHLDKGGMIVDFGILKNEVKDFIDSFDHSYMVWERESEEFHNFLKKYSDRLIILPVTPSAEELSRLMLYVVDKIVRNYMWANGEGGVSVRSVRYHETTTGYAESFQSDLEGVRYDLNDITFSEAIQEEWNSDWLRMLKAGELFINKPVKQQI